MKKAVLIILALVTAALITEAVISSLIRYPAFGVLYKVRYRVGGETWSNIRKPHTKYYNVENRTLTNYNNYGLPGKDIDDLHNPIVLLGNSLVEALQYKPEYIASTVFENALRKNDPTTDVVNLGCSGHDPYDSYFRLKYFEKKLGMNTEEVLLIVSGDAVNWFKRHPQPFRFELGPEFGKVNNNPLVKLQIKLRNSSSLIEVIVKGILKDITGDNRGDELEQAVKQIDGSEQGMPDSRYDLSQEMQDCLIAYSKDYDGFIVVSISAEGAFNSTLENFCRENQIECIFVPILKPENLINGAGHINHKGNQELGSQMAHEYLKLRAGNQL